MSFLKLKFTEPIISSAIVKRTKISASNSAFQCSIDTYLNIDHFMEFGKNLEHFGQSIDDEVVLEVGKENKEFDFLYLKAYMYNIQGHAALEVIMRCYGEPVDRDFAHINIRTEVASLNRLGQTISKGTLLVENKLEYRFYP